MNKSPDQNQTQKGNPQRKGLRKGAILDPALADGPSAFRVRAGSAIRV